MSIGPGVICPRATPSMKVLLSSHAFVVTTSWNIKGNAPYPPPKEKSTIFDITSDRSKSLLLSSNRKKIDAAKNPNNISAFLKYREERNDIEGIFDPIIS